MTSGWDLLATAVGGALGGGIIGIVGQQLIDHCKRPKLRIHFENKEEYCPLTPQGEIQLDGKFVQTDEAYWLRIKVTNDGKSIARACRAYITRLSRINSDGTAERMDNQDALTIRWAIINETVTDLPRGVNQFSGICSTKKSAAHRLEPTTPKEAIRLERVWEKPGRFELKIVVTAENAEPTCKSIRFEWGGAWGTLKPLA